MANSFSNNVKVKLVAGAIADAMDYTKASVSKMPQSEFKGKKYGKSYKVYIPGTAKVVDGIVADPSDIVEVETEIQLTNKNVSVELNAWNELGDIENFRDQIAKPLGNQLARAEEKAIVRDNVFKSAQAVVAASAGFGVLSKAAAALRNLAVGGEIVSFQNPDVMATIATSGLANFIPSEIQKGIYGDSYLGQYSGAAQVETPDLPTITIGSAPTGTTNSSLVAIQDADNNTIGYEPVTTITGTNLVVGAAFKVTGLKVVDTSGIETDQDFIAIVTSVNGAGTSGTINPIRITVSGKGCNNPNAWVAASTTTLVYTSLLSASTTYYVGQVRTKDCFAFDAYKFENLPGSENEEVGVVGGHSVKMSMYGDGINLQKLIRLDAPFAAGLFEPRGSVTVYIAKS